MFKLIAIGRLIVDHAHQTCYVMCNFAFKNGLSQASFTFFSGISNKYQQNTYLQEINVKNVHRVYSTEI